ncbi:uncharacterized protein LOC115765106 [Drosophila novamexicana]|uniref:uncharacterized protein LOC115765106 n=1 Tax=Drosophila novamexicana TaxID=47314 RepID=UPI0011E5E733|nr:uncharacterized protein LOC115765106 [Drosophila novamexicana]
MKFRLIEDFEFLRLADRQTPLPAPSSGTKVSVGEFLAQWVASCLRSRCLSRCVQSLVADKELLDCYYQRDVAYLRHSGYAAALFVCLTAIELDQSSLLSQLEPLNKRRHRRTSSQPNFSITQRLHVVQEEEQQQQHLQLPSSPRPLQLLRRIKSLPCLYQNDCSVDRWSPSAMAGPAARRPRCQTYNSPCGHWRSQRKDLQPLSGSSISNASSCSQVGSPASPASRRIQLINCDDIKIWTDQTGSSSGTPPAHIPAKTKPTTQCAKRGSPLNSFLNNLFGSPPVYTSWYSKSLGQDEEANSAVLMHNFLPVNGRKLDKRQRLSLFEGVSMLDYNDCQASTATTTTTAPLDISSSGNKIDNQSLTAFLQMSRNTHNNTELEKENAHFRISEACIAAIEHVKWSRRGQPAADAASSAIANADADALLIPYAEQQSSHCNCNNSAEAVGLQLISRFNDQQLPKLGDLKWLVSEQDAPQQLLPLPKLQEQQPQLAQQQQLHHPHQLASETSLTRGTKTWAPPRQQIIFTEHAPASRSQLLARQNYRCAGCGMHVTRQYQQYFRYCNYLGKYLCTGCHRNQLSAIPAKILQAWDFRSYAVSSFAYRLIEQMYTFPLFHVPDLNAQLYVKQKLLAMARRRRLQLKYVRDFIAACRFATREQALFDAVPAHITNDPDMWSMCDFVDVQNNSMCRSIEELIALNEQHVHGCVLCTGRAFVCEYCKSRQLIYPWQRKVQRCAQCGACAHYNCWKSNSAGICSRCERLQGRKRESS